MNGRRALYGLSVLLLSMALGTPATADRLARLDDRSALFGWEAVGRVDIAGAGYCTGVLIAPHLVLTAAHCVFDPGGRQHDEPTMLFRAGLSDGESLAESRVRRVAVLDAYDPLAGMTEDNIRSDAALLELASPVPTGVADPFALHEGVTAHDKVSTVSYGRNRDRALSWQRECAVIGQGRGLIAFDCDVTYGSSGAPIFDLSGQRARIVSLVVGGTRTAAGNTVAYGMTLPPVVAELKRILRSLPTPGGAPGFKRLRVGQGGQASGAKFARP